MKNIKLFSFWTLFLLLLSVNNFAQNKTEPMPKWLTEHMTYMTEGTGVWIADNSKYESENEPFDEYGTEWKWGIGKKGITGRLFALKDKKEVATFWEFRMFWHPKKRKAVLQQFSGSGIVGIGEMRNVETGGFTERMSEMTFYNLDGTSWKDLHKVLEKPNEHETTSFKFDDGSWIKQRNYVWKRR